MPIPDRVIHLELANKSYDLDYIVLSKYYMLNYVWIREFHKGLAMFDNLGYLNIRILDVNHTWIVGGAGKEIMRADPISWMDDLNH